MPRPSRIEQVPQVVGSVEPDAIAKIEQTNLRVVHRGDEPSRLQRGQVTRTEPASGAMLRPGTLVGYWLANGQNIVPDVRGSSNDAAITLLQENGFRVGAIVYVSSNGDAVEAQDPVPGTRAALDSPVAITIGRRGGSPTWLLLGGGALALAVVAAGTLGWRNHLMIKLTRSLLAIRPSLDLAGETAVPDRVAPEGPATQLQARLEPGETTFEGNVPIVRREIEHD
jgi:hypothetical protein